MTGIFNIEEAWDKDVSVVVHPDLPNYKLGKFPPPQLVPDRPNVCNYRTLCHGNVEQGFKEADLVIENKFTTCRLQHCSLETHVCIAQAEHDGALTIWGGRQSLFLAKQYLCAIFDLPPSKVRIINSYYIGGGFGSKVTLYTEPIASILSMKTGRPVRLAFEREEMFHSGGTRVPFVITIKDGVKMDGTIISRQMTMLLGMGAYSGSGPLITRNTIYALASTYKIPNVKMDSYAVYTNEPIVTSFRGFGTSQPVWAIESQMDILAQKLGLDAIDIRKKNLLKEGDKNATGEIVHSIGAKECLNKAADLIEWAKVPKQSEGVWRRGKGIALGNKYSMAPTAAVAIVKLLEDGTIELRESADEMGQGCNTILAQIAAEEFKTSINKIKVVWGDTDFTPYFSRGSTSQRTTFNLGNAVRLACKDAKNQLLMLASKKLNVNKNDLGIKDGLIFSYQDNNTSMKIKDVFVAERDLLPGETGSYTEELGEIIGKGIYVIKAAWADPKTAQIPSDVAQKGGRLAGSYGYAAQAFELLVNIETGEIKVEKIVSVADVGYPLNPKMCEQQIEGGLGMGLSSALTEEVMLDKGRVLNPDFTDYKISVASDMPSLNNTKISIVSVMHENGPYGAKGIGETQMTPTAPAVANAVYNAIGIGIYDLPITREKVFKALLKKCKG